MKYFFAFLFNVLIFTSLLSQNVNYLRDNDTSLLFQKKNYPAINKYDNKMQFHITTGASVTTNGNNSIFSQWIAPSFSYQINPKLNLHFGSLILNGNQNYPSFNKEILAAPQTNSTQTFIYISGDYQLNKSIRFRATTFNEIQDKKSMQQNYYYNQMGVDIKITDNFVISADFINEKGRRPFGIYNSNKFFDQYDYNGNGFFNNGLINTFR